MRRRLLLVLILLTSSLMANQEPKNNVFPYLLTDTPQTAEDVRLRTDYDDGFYLEAGRDTLRVGAYAQPGFRTSGDAQLNNSEFYIRRARLIMRGVLHGDWGYYFEAGFEGSSAKLKKWYGEYIKYALLRGRLGQFVVPFSREAVISNRWTYVIESSLGTSNLAPFEDIGAMLFGTLYGKKIEYAVGLFNGTGQNVVDNNNGKMVGTRITFSPWSDDVSSAVRGLTVGGSLTRGSVSGSLSTITYVTAAQTTFTSFTSAATQNSYLTRYDIEAQYLNNSFKIAGEYFLAWRQGVTIGAGNADVTNRAWYLAANYLLTGEKQVADTGIVPLKPFDEPGGTGAWELAARAEAFTTNSSAFSNGFCTGTPGIAAYTIGTAWWPNRHIRAMGNMIYNKFSGPLVSSAGTAYHHETAVILQVLIDF